MSENPHMHLIAIDPPGSTNRRWRCAYCGCRGVYSAVMASECMYTYPLCDRCGQAPECAPNCPGIAEVLGRDDVYVIGEKK
jgi:transcription elongation factor Elf1